MIHCTRSSVSPAPPIWYGGYFWYWRFLGCFAKDRLYAALQQLIQQLASIDLNYPDELVSFIDKLLRKRGVEYIMSPAGGVVMKGIIGRFYGRSSRENLLLKSSRGLGDTYSIYYLLYCQTSKINLSLRGSVATVAISILSVYSPECYQQGQQSIHRG